LVVGRTGVGVPGPAASCLDSGLALAANADEASIRIVKRVEAAVLVTRFIVNLLLRTT
jgi:hypothetical protein